MPRVPGVIPSLPAGFIGSQGPGAVRSTTPTRESIISSDRTIGLQSDKEKEELLLAGQVGVWIDVFSEYLFKIRFDWVSPWPKFSSGPPSLSRNVPLEQRRGYLTAQFLDLAIVGYANEPYKVFQDAINSSSKGSYWWHASSGLQGKSGDKIQKSQRKVTAEMRRARSASRAGAGGKFRR